MEELLAEQKKLQKDGVYLQAVEDVEKTLELLQNARDAIATGQAFHNSELANLPTLTPSTRPLQCGDNACEAPDTSAAVI